MVYPVYTNGVAPAIDAGNLNSVNNVVQNILGTGVNPPANASDVRTNLGLSPLATATQVNLTTQVSGVLPIANGGTGNTTNTATNVTGVVAVVNGGTGDTGTAWSTMATGAVSASSGTISNATGVTRYKILGKTVFFQTVITITNNGSGAGAINVLAVLPVAPFQAIQIAGRESATSGWSINMTQNTAGVTNVSITKYDNSYPAITGSVLVFCGVYESA